MRYLTISAAMLALAVLVIGQPARAAGDHHLYRGHTAAYWHWRWTAAHRQKVVAQRSLVELEQVHRRAMRGVRESVMHAIHVAAIAYGIDEQQMRTVAACESGFDPWNRNRSSTASGVFQFLDSTWAHTPFAGMSVYDPYANSLAAAWLVRQDGGWREWQCKP